MKSLKVNKLLFGENNPCIAKSYVNLGFLSIKMENFPKAEEYYLKSLKINMEIYGENNSSTADYNKNLGEIIKYMFFF